MSGKTNQVNLILEMIDYLNADKMSDEKLKEQLKKMESVEDEFIDDAIEEYRG